MLLVMRRLHIKKSRVQEWILSLTILLYLIPVVKYDLQLSETLYGISLPGELLAVQALSWFIVLMNLSVALYHKWNVVVFVCIMVLVNLVFGTGSIHTYR